MEIYDRSRGKKKERGDFGEAKGIICINILVVLK